MAKKKKTPGSTPPPAPKLEQFKLVEPATSNQKKVFTAFKKGNHLCLSGSAGSGKTFIAIYLALEEILRGDSPRERLVIVRSAVPTRDMGFLPGDRIEKESTYLTPYIAICTELTGDPQAWNKLVAKGVIQFLTTSFIRGTTIRNSTVLVDEMQNLTFHELDSIITRLGEDCRFIMCGDYYQTDLEKKNDKTGILEFIKITDQMKYFTHVQFGWEDIVRSGLVRDYIMTKEMLQKEEAEKAPPTKKK
jgi:phosphate starvation-inducible PhoH-like protein